MSFVVSGYSCAIHKEIFEDELSIPLFVKKGMDSWLDGLGINTHTPGISYGENGRSAYNAYWESRFPELVEEGVIEKITTGNPPDEMLQFIIDEYNGSFSVDAEGFINLNIPKYLLDAATNIEIGLQDFPVLLEATHQSEANSENNVLRENNNTGNGTNY